MDDAGKVMRLLALEDRGVRLFPGPPTLIKLRVPDRRLPLNRNDPGTWAGHFPDSRVAKALGQTEEQVAGYRHAQGIAGWAEFLPASLDGYDEEEDHPETFLHFPHPTPRRSVPPPEARFFWTRAHRHVDYLFPPTARYYIEDWAPGMGSTGHRYAGTIGWSDLVRIADPGRTMRRSR